ncbi:MAG: BsuPI-related putative proteinase inhibitor [Elusimicrobiota bacterium]
MKDEKNNNYNTEQNRTNVRKCKTEQMFGNAKPNKCSALEQLFCLIEEGIKLNPEEYKISFTKFILTGFLILVSVKTIFAISAILSPNRPAYSYQYIPIYGTASENTKKVEIQICQVESKTYWNGQCWVSTPKWLVCTGTSSWTYNLATYFSDNLTYNIKSQATDASGNIEPASDGITFIIDTRPPYSYLTLPDYSNKTYSDIPKIYGQAGDSKSGVAFVRVRLRDLTDGTYWNGNSWDTDEIWLKADGTDSFSVPVSVWIINHQYNAIAQAVDFAQLEEGLNSGCNFYIDSALNLSVKSSKTVYNYGEQIEIKIEIENPTNSTQILELLSSPFYDFMIDSSYRYSDGATFLPVKTAFCFQPGKTVYSEKIDNILPIGKHNLTAELKSLNLTTKSSFEIISDTVSPAISHQPVADGQYKHFSIPVSAKIIDNSRISTVVLHSGNTSWQMTKITGENIWAGMIPAEYNNSSSVSYYIEAVDISGNKTITDTKTITTIDVPLVEPKDIIVTPIQDNKYEIKITNFAAKDAVFYRVYYDRGNGVIDYSTPIGTIDELKKTVITPTLEPATNYELAIVPQRQIDTSVAEPTNSDIATSVSNNQIILFIEGINDPVSTTTANVPITLIFSGLDGNDAEVLTDSEIITQFITFQFVDIIPVSQPLSLMPKQSVSTSDTASELIPVTISYIDANNDGYLDGTNIKETTLVIMKYDEVARKWVGGFETTIDTERNFCSAYVDRVGIYAVFSVLQIYPAPISNLTGTAVDKYKAKIEWSHSNSVSSNQYNIYYQNGHYYEKNYTAKYRIYWDKGIGMIDYLHPLVELEGSQTQWISQPLSIGLYKFAVRVVDIEGTEEQNTNYITVNIGMSGTASANIRIPKDGQRLRGNAVTIIADVSADTTGVLFQYKVTEKQSDGATEKWIDITSIDTKSPYAVYWNLSGLANSEYKLRAVAFDLLELAQPNPSEITVYIDDTNWDISEDGNPSVDPNTTHRKQEKISESTETIVMIADGTSAIVPEGTVEKETVLEIKTITQQSLPLPTDSSLEAIDVFREYNFSNGKSEFEKEITISLPYPDDNNDGIVDGTTLKSDILEIYYLDEKNNEWKKANNRLDLGDATNPGQNNSSENAKNDRTDNPTNKHTNTVGYPLRGILQAGQGDLGQKVISAKVNHFTKFGIFAKTPRDFLTDSQISVYPNPFKPSKGGDTEITFDGLTENVRIKIYTIAGRLADEFETTTDGSCNWKPELASGVYIYYIEDKNGKGKAKGKLAIIR